MKLREGSPEDAGVSSSQVRKIVERAHSWVQEGFHPALVVLAARRGVIFLHEAIGRMGPQEDSPAIQHDTIFPLASISKPFTAAAAMTLVEDGLLGLNRPVAEYLPAFREGGKGNILIRNLLTHSSGIKDEVLIEHVQTEHPEKSEAAATRWMIENFNETIDLIVRTPLAEPPDTVMRYADTNYNLLGEIIDRVAGTSLGEFAQERIFSPLGLKDTHYLLPREIRHRVVQRAETAPGYQASKTWQEFEFGSGSVHTTALDAATFAQMQLNQGRYGEVRILSAASVAAMTHDQIPGLGARILDMEFPHAAWSLGWSMHAPSKGPLYGEQMQSASSFVHGGAGGVYLWVDPMLDVIGVYFSVQQREGDNFTKGCADLYMNMVQASVDEI